MSMPGGYRASCRPVVADREGLGRSLVGLLTAVAVIVLCVSGCGAGGTATSASSPSIPSTQAEPETSPSPPVSVDGPGYHFTTPAGWTFVPASGNWEEGPGNYPDFDTPGFAKFFAPNDTADIVIGRRPTPRGMALQTWTRAMTKNRTLVYPDVFCRPPHSIRRHELAGEPAELRLFRCPGVDTNAAGALVLAVHRGYGYALLCFLRDAGVSASFPQQCLGWLSTFRFAA
jgi:hypothetical protein